MKPTSPGARLALALLLAVTPVAAAFAQETVETANGTLTGTVDAASGLRSFKGIPFAAPPVGELRWKPPQPAPHWDGVRKAEKFGPRAMQRSIFNDMIFRSDGMSEDCLYLNVWTPAKSKDEKLPVMVYFFGGGFIGGDGSEGRYDGANIARKGIVSVTINYRLNIFGFFSHPALTKESPQHASGNYGLLDQHAALEWISRNIAAFGGDPKHITIAGESAGSMSVSAQMASPLSRDLIAGAIGESGSVLGAPAPVVPLAQGEADGVKFAASLGLGEAPSLAELRALPAERLLEATAKLESKHFHSVVDGYFFPKDPAEIYRAGEQAHVPLLAGVNSEENGYDAVLKREKPTVENYRQALQRLYGDKADAVFKMYPAANDDEVKDVARELASDRFISYGTWKWMDESTKSGGQASYYYVYAHPRPPTRAPEDADPNKGSPTRGAVHAAEIEYALGNLGTNKTYAWSPEDEEVSRVMMEYFANFIETGNPNGSGLPEWPKFATGQRLVIDVKPHAESNDQLRARYDFLGQFYGKK